MSKLFHESEGVIVDLFGVVHRYDTWRTDQDESHQYTDCGVYMNENVRGEYMRLHPATYLTCIACAVGRQYGRRT